VEQNDDTSDDLGAAMSTPHHSGPGGGATGASESTAEDDRRSSSGTTGAGGDETDARGRGADSPTEVPAQGWKDVGARTFRQIREDNVVLMAAGVAFFALLALVPALVAFVSLYGIVADPADVERHVNDMLAAAPADVREMIQAQLDAAVDRSPTAATLSAVIAIALALWSASAGTKHLIGAVNAAYDEPESRGFVKLRGLALLMTLGAIVFVVVAFGAIAVLPAILGEVGLGDAARVTLNVLRWPLIALFLMAALAVAYRVAPDRDDPRWRWASPGAVVAVVLWIVGSALFSVYTANFGDYDETYGSLAGIVVTMLWLFLSAFIVILGAEINSELERQTAEDTTKGPREPMGQRQAVAADTVGPTAGELKASKSQTKVG
jgi:membrane protein